MHMDLSVVFTSAECTPGAGGEEMFAVSLLSVGKVQLSCFSSVKRVNCISIRPLLLNLTHFLPDEIPQEMADPNRDTLKSKSFHTS